MATVAVGDICKLTIYSRSVQQVAVNRLMLRCKAIAGVSVSDQLCANLFYDDIKALYKVWMSATSEILGTRFQIVRPIDHPHVRSTGALTVGTAPGTALPPQNAVDLRLKTPNTGKTNRGRQYLPFWDDSFLLAGGFLTAPGVTAAANYASYIVGPLVIPDGLGNHAEFELIIDSKGSGDIPQTIPPHVTVVTGVEVVTSFATQRRRSNINRNDSFGP